MKNLAPGIRIGVLVQKCTCKKGKGKCDCGGHGPVFIDREAHDQFVKNIFSVIN